MQIVGVVCPCSNTNIITFPRPLSKTVPDVGILTFINERTESLLRSHSGCSLITFVTLCIIFELRYQNCKIDTDTIGVLPASGTWPSQYFFLCQQLPSGCELHTLMHAGCHTAPSFLVDCTPDTRGRNQHGQIRSLAATSRIPFWYRCGCCIVPPCALCNRDSLRIAACSS